MSALNNAKTYGPMFLMLLAGLLSAVIVSAQVQDSVRRFIPGDSLQIKAPIASDSARMRATMRTFVPRKATIRSALFPGLGQIYNKKYWKLPIIYGALGVSGAVFVYNLRNYRDLRLAYRAKFNAARNPPDSTEWKRIRQDLLPLDINALRSYRDEFRSNIDYSVLVFILLWGLNVVDATVDAHLKAFDVNPDLSFQIKFGRSEMAGTNGLSLVLAFK